MAFVVGGSEHSDKDKRCCECYRGYPQECQCGGLIHAQFMRASWNGIIELEYSCDMCREKYKEKKFKKK